ncbi:PREDICTED: glycine cleavage system H protein, mitochondrial-like isoform 1 [Fragaria vesca subsp. vesca]
MASRLASRAASYLRIQVTHRGFASVVKDLNYANSHEWVKVDGKSATIGITDHAQDHLGDVVYVELPEVGVAVKQGEGFGAVESVKATSDVYSPVSGKVVEVNEELNSSPGLKTIQVSFTSVNHIVLYPLHFLYENLKLYKLCAIWSLESWCFFSLWTSPQYCWTSPQYCYTM